MSKNPEVKRHKTHVLRLTKFELLHLRDLFSILLPPDTKKTMSQALADLENRTLVESVLWNKVQRACVDAGLPMEDEAPDYIVAPVSTPEIGVFQLAHEPSVQAQAEAAAVFPGDNEEEDE